MKSILRIYETDYHVMKRLALPLSVCCSVFLLAACTPSRPISTVMHEPDVQRGMQIYVAHCGGCHDSGRGGAPTLDDVEEWDERSIQWQTLMRDHARKGFLRMPAKGGQAHLSDRDVRDALYFMDIKLRSNED